MIYRGMDLKYVSEDVANKHFGYWVRTPEKELIEDIMKSTILDDVFPKDEVVSIKAGFITEALEMKRELAR